MSREAMKLALEALEYIHEGANNQGPHTGISWRCVSKKAEPVISALREALAEPQEKYIYGTPLLDAMTGKANEALDKKAENARELGLDYEPAQQEPVFTYDQVKAHIQAAMMSAAQRTWVGLTDEEKSDIWCVVTNRDFVTEETHVYADAIEAKLKEKNT